MSVAEAVRAPVRARRVVIADDAEPLRALLATKLGADERFDVVGQAADGDSAVDVAVATDADAVLLDLSMPGADGIHALRRLQVEAPRIAAVVLSGFRAGEFAGEVLELGAVAYVEKGVDLDELASILDDACGDEITSARVATPTTEARVAPSPLQTAPATGAGGRPRRGAGARLARS